MEASWRHGRGRRASGGWTVPPQPPASGEDGGSNPTINFHGEKRSNDPTAPLPIRMPCWHARAGAAAAMLAYRGHLLTENRNGLVVATRTTQAYGVPNAMPPC